MGKPTLIDKLLGALLDKRWPERISDKVRVVWFNVFFARIADTFLEDASVLKYASAFLRRRFLNRGGNF